MAWDVNDILNLTKFLTRKNQSGSISAKDLFYAWNSEQTAFFQDLLGRWQARAMSKTGVNTGLIQNETILTKLSPFTLPQNITITAGAADKPTDFVYRLALRINGADCIKINHNQIASINANVIDPPSIINNQFYFVEYQDYYSFLPTGLPTASITTAQLDYLKLPAEVIWGFTLDAQKRQVYNAGTSVQPGWLDMDVVEITKRTLASFGVSYHDKDFEQFGKTAQLMGN